MTGHATDHLPSLRRRRWLIAGFIPIVLLALGADSQLLLERGIDGQIFSNIAGPLYLLLLLSGLRPEQRLTALIFVPFSAVGEYIFSLILQLYAYKFGEVPFYVPFGHAILLGTAMLIAELPSVQANDRLVRHGLLAFHGMLFGGALIWYGDTLSAIFGLLFGYMLWRRGPRPLYLIVGVLVLYIELVGTMFGCWAWDLTPFDLLSTTNPPVGAFVCYVIADILVIKIARRVSAIRVMQRGAA
jgi:hypothetical protein